MSFSKIHKICCACVHIMSCIPFSADILCSTREIRGGTEREGRILASALWPQAQYRFEGNSLLLSFFADLSATLFSGFTYLVFQNVLDLKCAAVYMHSDLAQNFSKQRGNEGAVCTKNNLASHTHFCQNLSLQYHNTYALLIWWLHPGPPHSHSGKHTQKGKCARQSLIHALSDAPVPVTAP